MDFVVNVIVKKCYWKKKKMKLVLCFTPCTRTNYEFIRELSVKKMNPYYLQKTWVNADV